MTEALELVLHNKRSRCNEKPAPQLESSPCLQQLEISPHSNKDPAQPKINEYKWINKNFKKPYRDLKYMPAQ